MFSNVPVFTCSWFYLINTDTKSFLHCGRVRRCHESALIASIFLESFIRPLAHSCRSSRSVIQPGKPNDVNKLKGDPQGVTWLGLLVEEALSPFTNLTSHVSGGSTYTRHTRDRPPVFQSKHWNTGGPSCSWLVVPNGDSERWMSPASQVSC